MRISRRSFLAALTFLFGAPFYLPAASLNVKGVAYFSLSDVARLCGMRVAKMTAAKTQTVYSKTSRLTFENNSKMFSLNGVNVWLGYPVVLNGGFLYIAKRDYVETIRPVLFPQQIGNPPNVFHIYIDAGHGGKDNGAMNRRYGLKEKNVTLDVAGRLGKILRKNGYRVTYTRTKDTTLELSDRTNAAIRNRANLFISIHCNAANSDVNGIETFAMTPSSMPSTSSKTFRSTDTALHAGNKSDDWDQLLSYYIQRDLVQATGATDRGVKRARFVVLKGTPMPSSLVEIGFISNNSDAQKLASSNYRQKIAASIASSIMRYHSSIRRLKKR